MFGPKTIHWAVSSKEDPRWDIQGSYLGFIMGGMPEEVEKKIKEKEKELKQIRPKSCMKD